MLDIPWCRLTTELSGETLKHRHVEFMLESVLKQLLLDYDHLTAETSSHIGSLGVTGVNHDRNLLQVARWDSAAEWVDLL